MRRVRAVSFCVLLVAAACAHAQPLPPIELIDLYGVRTLDEQAVRAALPFREGDAIDGNEDWAAFEREVSAALGVAETRLTLVCCTQSLGSVLYVGIAERPGTHVAYRSVPTGDVELPADVLAVDEAFSAALLEAAAAGDVAEDHAQGHSLARHPALRAAQEKFLGFARDDPELFARVLRESANAAHRAIAATIVGYAADKAWAARELEAAAFDADEGVRNNAVRALSIVGAYGREHAEAGIEIDYLPFVDLLNSLEQSDRNKASMLLYSSGAAPSRAVLGALEERASVADRDVPLANGRPCTAGLFPARTPRRDADYPGPLARGARGARRRRQGARRHVALSRGCRIRKNAPDSRLAPRRVCSSNEAAIVGSTACFEVPRGYRCRRAASIGSAMRLHPAPSRFRRSTPK
jgi:hypothetical protein